MICCILNTVKSQTTVLRKRKVIAIKDETTKITSQPVFSEN